MSRFTVATILILASCLHFNIAACEKSDSTISLNPDKIEKIIIYALNPDLISCIDECRVTFFGAWRFGGMRSRTITDRDSIAEMTKLLAGLTPIDTLAYDTFESETHVVTTRRGLILFFPPKRLGPDGAMIMIHNDGTPNSLIWITPFTLDIGKLVYPLPDKIEKMLRDIGRKPIILYKSLREIYPIWDIEEHRYIIEP